MAVANGNLTLEQKATNDDTWHHIHRVQQLIGICIVDLLNRANNHDQSKLKSPEVEGFAEYTDKLAGCTYGSEEYNGYRQALKPILDHHYARNRHHPEHFKEGIEEMNLLDFLEMLMDWKASSERHHDGNIRKSIEINGNRFQMSPQLIRIMENTVDYLDFQW